MGVKITRKEWEIVLLGKEKAERRARVRQRQSYKLWSDLSDFLRKRPSEAEILRKIMSVTDSMKAWRYRTRAEYASESLELFLEDSERA